MDCVHWVVVLLGLLLVNEAWACGTECSYCAGASGACGFCNSGFYRDQNAPYKNCLSCSSCNSRQRQVWHCVTGNDVVCETCASNQRATAYQCISCVDGVTYASTDQTRCDACTQCTTSQYLPNGNECTGSSNAVCLNCADNRASKTVNSLTCNSCASGYYLSGATGSCVDCNTPSCPTNTYIKCTVGERLCVTCTGHTQASPCPFGTEPNRICTGTQSADAQCDPCGPGTERPAASVSTTMRCFSCGLGYAKPAVSTLNCMACTNKPATNSLYLTWGTTPAGTYDCPWGCNAGYYKQDGLLCVSCAATAGRYSDVSTHTACWFCTNKPLENTYYLIPKAVDGFNAATNTCPWECDVGYRLTTTKDSCTSCVAGSTYHSTNVQTEGDANICQTCRTCTDGVNYETHACTPSVNRVCVACTTHCPNGKYQQYPCSVTKDLTCKSCVTTCPVDSYLSSATCSGDTTVDSVLEGCIPCKTPVDCPGMYVSSQCLGSSSYSNQCWPCSVVPVGGDCLSSQYRGGCAGYSDTHCIPFTVCAAGMYLSGESRTQDGTCMACTSCTALGLTTLQACSMYDDAVCKLGSCDPLVPCVTPQALTTRLRLFCAYVNGQSLNAFCGMCPSGYGSDGQFCLECPRGKTCNRLGEVECQGQCGAGFESVCEVEFTGGYAWCETPCVQAIVPDATRLVRRGTHIRPDTGRCDTYLQCAPGFYKSFRSTGVIDCVPCVTDGNFDSLMRWVTEGLSVGDPYSCLWECKRELASRHYKTIGQCTQSTGRETAGIARNIEGWYGVPGSAQTCGYGKTSEADTAHWASECVPCPTPPTGAELTWNSLSCDWACVGQGGMARVGGACVSKRAVCDGVAGFVRAGGVADGCVPTAFPWNQAGYSKSGWGAAVVTSGGVAGSGILEDGLLPFSLNWGKWERNSVSKVGEYNRFIQGPLCSASLGWVNGREYIFGTVCNQSFLIYVNASNEADSSVDDWGLHILAGQPGAPGWKDGFRTVAQFESELYVTSASEKNGTLYVLDRWNCLLREVTINGEPGGYLTRVDTVYGVTEKFNLVGQPKCYGDGSLAWPRRFWWLRDGWVAFADEDGLWQFHTSTHELAVMVKESALTGFEADSLLDVDATDVYTVRLVFMGGVVWTIMADQVRCPDESTSMAGGDCMVGCTHLDSKKTPVHWVSDTTGLCMPCTKPMCGYGQELIECVSNKDAYCSECDLGDPACLVCPVDAINGQPCVQCDLSDVAVTGSPGIYSDVVDSTVWRFTSSSGTVRFSSDVRADIMVIGGGGSGGTNQGGGGGGAGTVIFATNVLFLGGVTLAITVGGAGQSSSIGSDFVAYGGGSGSKAGSFVGGSGGGVGGPSTVFGVSGVYTSTNAFANAGASGGKNSYFFGGAGGGAGGPGTYGQCGAGGIGLSRVTISNETFVFSNVFGQAYTSVAFNGAVAGGGTGAKCCDGSNCGSDGLGGNGGGYTNNGGSGRTNTGSGGGGAYIGTAGVGGSGLVLIKKRGVRLSQVGQTTQTCTCQATNKLMFKSNGTCEANMLRTIPPCEIGSYAVSGYCEVCPEFTSTWKTNAYGVEKCKCDVGLSRRISDGACVGEALFAGWDLACAASCGSPPLNATFTTPSCAFECNTGFFHNTSAGWDEKCTACSGQGVATTRGDDDSPWSCERV